MDRVEGSVLEESPMGSGTEESAIRGREKEEEGTSTSMSAHCHDKGEWWKKVRRSGVTR